MTKRRFKKPKPTPAMLAETVMRTASGRLHNLASRFPYKVTGYVLDRRGRRYRIIIEATTALRKQVTDIFEVENPRGISRDAFEREFVHLADVYGWKMRAIPQNPA